MQDLMSTIAKLTGCDFDSMVERGAFDAIGPKTVELIRGELRFMNPAGPIHNDYIQYLADCSYGHGSPSRFVIRDQSGFVCDESRAEPDILWLKPKRYGRSHPTADDVLLLIEVADQSLAIDLSEKADLYAESGIAEYWAIDIPASRIHVMSNSDGRHYRDIRVVVPPDPVAPICRPAAELATSDLFEVR
jgi:Uma2 family endonuclease